MTWKEIAREKDQQVRNLAAKVAALQAENDRLRQNLPSHPQFCCAAFEELAATGCIDCLTITYHGDNHAFDREDMAQWRYENCTEDDEIAGLTFADLASKVAIAATAERPTGPSVNGSQGGAS